MYIHVYLCTCVREQKIKYVRHMYTYVYLHKLVAYILFVIPTPLQIKFQTILTILTFGT